MSSRIIIKNLPPYIDNEELKKHFSSKGTLTDVKVMRTTSGKSRRFAFVGYRDSQSAQEAVNYFNNTFIDTFRISVEEAKAAGDSSLPKPWRVLNREHFENNKPQDEEETIDEKNQDQTSENSKPKKGSKDEKFQEFLEVMKPRVNAKPWANNEIIPVNTTLSIPTNQDDKDFIEIHSSDSQTSDEKIQEEEIVEPSAPADDNAANDSTMSDMDYLRTRMKRRLAGDVKPIETEEHNEEFVNSEHKGIKRKAEAVDGECTKAEQILDTGRLFVRNLTYDCTDEQLKEVFEKFGPVAEVHMPIDKSTRSLKGFAYVSFMIPEHAVKAYVNLDGKSFQGRLLHILPAAEKHTTQFNDPNMSSVKSQRESKKKNLAGNSFNWNSLFMSANAVASSIASRLGIDKAAIFNPESSDAAIKLAQAETHLINETKKNLEEQGLDLSSFGKKDRSDSVILVKNIPFGTTIAELSDLFGKFGPLGRVLLPPAGTLAVVEFLTSAEGRAAFKALAYRKFKDSPLYLEKAPMGVLSTERKEPKSTEPAEVIKDKHAELDQVLATQDDEDIDTASIFVKNLNFDTTEDRLRQAFKHMEGFRTATIKTKPDPKNSGQRLSMGFGFLEFKTPEQAKNVVKAMHKFTLDGHVLDLKFSSNRPRGVVDQQHQRRGKVSVNDESATKITVKNVPFEATRKDIRALFEAFGKIKSVRLPQKFDRSSRGFAFLEFSTHKEAKHILDTMQNTHLLGRRLVLEWSEDAESLQKLREKARKDFSKDTGLPGQKKKMRVSMEENQEDEDL